MFNSIGHEPMVIGQSKLITEFCCIFMILIKYTYVFQYGCSVKLNISSSPGIIIESQVAIGNTGNTV